MTSNGTWLFHMKMVITPRFLVLASWNFVSWLAPMCLITICSHLICTCTQTAYFVVTESDAELLSKPGILRKKACRDSKTRRKFHVFVEINRWEVALCSCVLKDAVSISFEIVSCRWKYGLNWFSENQKLGDTPSKDTCEIISAKIFRKTLKSVFSTYFWHTWPPIFPYTVVLYPQ